MTRSSANAEKPRYTLRVGEHLAKFSTYNNSMPLKSRSGVIQGHLKWHHSIGRICFPVRVLQQL